jgi:hypothetical protein
LLKLQKFGNKFEGVKPSRKYLAKYGINYNYSHLYKKMASSSSKAGAMTSSITTLGIMTLRIEGLFTILSIKWAP